jgi:hypothetical protein
MTKQDCNKIELNALMMSTKLGYYLVKGLQYMFCVIFMNVCSFDSSHDRSISERLFRLLVLVILFWSIQRILLIP